MNKQRLSWLLDLVFPPHCVHCGSSGTWFCASCQTSIKLCSGQQRTRFHPSSLASLHAVGWHRGALRSAILALKYDGMQVLADPLGKMLNQCWKGYARVDMVVPVALHVARARSRGYNQAELLARSFAAKGNLMLNTRLLVRQKPTASQVGLGREKRWQNVREAFECIEEIDGARVLLIDDVLTTGATMEAAAAALKNAGATHVYGLAVARALHVDQKT